MSTGHFPAQLPEPLDVEDEGVSLAVLDAVEAIETDGGLRNPGEDDHARHNNRVRAQWAATAVRSYMQVLDTDHDQSVNYLVADLLGDLRHFCDAANISFAENVAGGDARYSEELRGDD